MNAGWQWRRLDTNLSAGELIQELNETMLKLTHRLTPRVVTMRSDDATPSVKDADLLVTSGRTTITGFDDGFPGQHITVYSGAPITFSTAALPTVWGQSWGESWGEAWGGGSGSSGLVGSAVSLDTEAGDVTSWVTTDGSTWRLTSFIDASADNSGGV